MLPPVSTPRWGAVLKASPGLALSEGRRIGRESAVVETSADSP